MHTIRHRLLDGLVLRETGVPIYVQLKDQLLHAIAAGLLAPGEQMPTMRQVAVALRVDLNTVRRTYDELERAGALVLQRGRGSFVAAAPPASDPTLAAARCEALAAEALAAARAAGVDPAEVAKRLLVLTRSGVSTS